MITLKYVAEVGTTAFQAMLNRQPTDFWVQAETAKEAEERLLELVKAGQEAERVQKDLLFRLKRVEGEVETKLQECETAMRGAAAAREKKLVDENELLTVKVRQLEEAVQQMKTAAQKPEKHSLWRRRSW